MLNIDKLHYVFAIQLLDEIELIFKHLIKIRVHVAPRLRYPFNCYVYLLFLLGAAPFGCLVRIKYILSFENVSRSTSSQQLFMVKIHLFAYLFDFSLVFFHI